MLLDRFVPTKVEAFIKNFDVFKFQGKAGKIAIKTTDNVKFRMQM